MAALIKSLLILLLIASPALAVDKKLVSTNTFALKLVSSADGSGLTGKTLGDIAVHYACAGDADSVIDESNDTLTEIDSTNAAGYYWIATDDSLGCTSEEEFLVWATGASVDPTPRLTKAITNIESDTKAVADATLADTGTDGVKVGADAIGASQIAADAIGASEIAANAIGASEIAAAAITVSEAPTLDADMTSRMAEASINTTAGAVDVVTLVTTTTTNTDMVGTDNAATASALSTHDGKLDTVDTNLDTLIVTVGAAGAGFTDLGGMSTAMKAEVEVEVDDALTAFGFATADSVATAVLEETIDGTKTMREILCAMAAEALGKSAGMGTSTVTFRNIDDGTDVITGTMDANYNRTAVTLSLGGCN